MKKKFRKKPVVIEAVQWLPHYPAPDVHNTEEIKEFCGEKCKLEGKYGLFIATLEGVMQANPLDWIVKGVNEEFYPVKPNIFKKTYEEL